MAHQLGASGQQSSGTFSSREGAPEDAQHQRALPAGEVSASRTTKLGSGDWRLRSYWVSFCRGAGKDNSSRAKAQEIHTFLSRSVLKRVADLDAYAITPSSRGDANPEYGISYPKAAENDVELLIPLLKNNLTRGKTVEKRPPEWQMGDFVHVTVCTSDGAGQ